MGVYLIGLFGGVSLGGLMSGFIINAKGWRWHFWVLYLPSHHCLTWKVGTIFAGINALAFLFLFPEPQYVRDTGDKHDPGTNLPEGKSDASQGHPVEVERNDPLANRKRTFLEELKPYSSIDPQKSYPLLLLKPLPLVLYPATVFGFLVFASSLGFFLAALSVNPSVFQAPPYNMSPAINGLINIPSLIGHLAGAFSGGFLTDKIAEWSARKNMGIFEPEARLIALIIPLIITPAGLLMLHISEALANGRFGLGIQHQTHWIVPFIGYGMTSFGCTSVPSIAMTYGVVFKFRTNFSP